MSYDENISLQDLYNEFNKSKIALESKIKTLKDSEELIACRSSIQDLSNSFSSNNSNFLQMIPAYDLKYYSESIDKLIELVEERKREIASRQGIKKFTFKNRTLKPNKALNSERTTERTAGKEFIKPEIANIIDQTYVIPESASKSLFIKTVENSTIKTPESAIPYSLHLSDLKNSRIVLSSKTSIFIDNLTHCQIITKSLQLRLHNITDSIIIPDILNEANRIVIEDCKGLQIGRQTGKSFVEVDDFKVPNKLMKNPNYDYLNDDNEVYKKINTLMKAASN